MLATLAKQGESAIIEIKKGYDMSDTKDVQWHPGFIAAVNLELAENRKDLIYEKEYNLKYEYDKELADSVLEVTVRQTRKS